MRMRCDKHGFAALIDQELLRKMTGKEKGLLHRN